MVHICLHERLLDKLSAQAVVRGHSVGAEIARRLELSFGVERTEPSERR